MGEPWWAAVYGVAQSWTRLKQFSVSKRMSTRRVDCPCCYGASSFHLLASGHNESRWLWSRLYFVVQKNEPWCCLLIRVCPFLGPISLTLHSSRITGAESTRSPGGSLEERVRLPLFFKKKKFIFLAMPGLSCGTWDLPSSLRHVRSFLFFQMWYMVSFYTSACRI